MKLISKTIFPTIKSLIYEVKGLNIIRPAYKNQNRNLQKMATPTLESIPKVDIDPSGVFKYILIKVYDTVKDTNREEPFITIVRGYQRCNYHSDIYDEVSPKLEPFESEPIGGGRISHEPNKKKIHIYGYSQGYGKADHEVTAKLVKDAYPGYAVSISDEGY